VIDPAIPGLERALDRDYVGACVERVLGLESGWTVIGCEFEKVRYRRGQRALVQFRVTGRGEEERQWLVAGSLHSGKDGRGVAAKLARLAIAPAPGLRSMQGFDPGTEMVLSVFPADRGLPGLVEFAKGRRVLGFRPEEASVARYRIGLSATLEVPAGFLKFHPSGGARRSHSVGLDLSRIAGVDVRLATPDRLDATVEATFVRRSPGTPLDQSGRAIEAAAGALAVLHRARWDVGVPRRERPRRRAHRAASWIRTVLPPASGLLAEIMSRPDPPGPSSVVHGDLKPEHVLVAPDGSVTFIDLDSAGVGRPLSDIASLYTRIEDEGARAALIESYDRSAGPVDWSGFATEVGLASVSWALFHAQRRRGGWQDAVLSTLELSRQVS